MKLGKSKVFHDIFLFHWTKNIYTSALNKIDTKIIFSLASLLTSSDAYFAFLANIGDFTMHRLSELSLLPTPSAES